MDIYAAAVERRTQFEMKEYIVEAIAPRKMWWENDASGKIVRLDITD